MTSCADCRYFAPRAMGAGTFVGQCRYDHPPAMSLQLDDGRRNVKLHAYWPLVDATDWCRDFEQAATPDASALVEALSTNTGELELVDLPPDMLRLCRYCQAQIIFGPTKETRMPLSWPHDPSGNVVFDPHNPTELVAVYRNGEAVPQETPPEYRWHAHAMKCPGAKRRKR